MFDPVIRYQIDEAREAGFPDPAAAVRLLFQAAGDRLDTNARLVDEADAWWFGFVEIPIALACRGGEVSQERLDIAVWADEWWDDLRSKL